MAQQVCHLSGCQRFYYRKAKEIISANREFFEKLAAALAEKKLLSAVDIQQIREDCRIVSVAI